MLKRFAAAALALFALVIVVLTLAPMLVPTDALKPRIEQEASKALGRDVAINGDISFRLAPRISFRANGLRIANSDGFDGDYLAQVEQADLGVRLLPLLSREVVIDSFVLRRPELNLQRAGDGSVNWMLGEVSAAASDQPPGAAPEASPAAGGELRELRLGDVRLIDGRARFVDQASDADYDLSAINLAVRLKNMRSPLEVDGALMFQDAPAELDIVLTDLATLNAGETANLKLEATLGDAAAGADLSIRTVDDVSYNGELNLDAPDLDALARLFGVELTDAPGFDRFSADGRVEGDSESVRFADAAISFDEIAATGDLALSWAGERPRASGALRTPMLDLRTYAPAASEASGGEFPPWSEEPLDLSSLRLADADLDVSADALRFGDYSIGASRLRVTLNDGMLTAALPVMTFYGGEGAGELIVNARATTPQFKGAFKIGAVDAGALAQDALRNDRLLGAGALNLEFQARGASQADIMKSLLGSGGFDFADGAIRGVNIVNLVNGVSSLFDGGAPTPAAAAAVVSAASEPNAQTDYSRFVTQFVMQSGAMELRDLALEGPFLSMGGSGGVNLGAQTVDLRLAPTVFQTADRTGAGASAPLRVSGTFQKPSMSVDLETLVRGRAESIGRDVLEDALGDDNPLSGLFKRTNAESDGGSDSSDAADVLDSAVGRLFQRRRQKDEPNEDDAGADENPQ